MDESILVGAGGHALACMDVIELSNQFKIAGLVEKDDADGQGNLGYPIIGTDNDLPNLRKKYSHALITIGQIKSPATRTRLFQLLRELDYQLALIVSPRAYVSKHASIGDGTIIMHGCIINAGAKIGKNCIINSKSLIEHDVVIEDHCHLATRSTVGGGAIIKKNSFIGSCSVIKQNIKIGKNCFVNANLFLQKDLKDNSKVL